MEENKRREGREEVSRRGECGSECMVGGCDENPPTSNVDWVIEWTGGCGGTAG